MFTFAKLLACAVGAQAISKSKVQTTYDVYLSMQHPLNIKLRYETPDK